MKINKKQIDMLTSLPDDSLRHIIKALGSSSGFDLSGVNLTDTELQKIRSILRDMNEEDINRAAQILKNRSN